MTRIGKLLLSFLILFIFGFSFSVHTADAAPAQVVARTGQSAVDAPGFTYASLFNSSEYHNLETPKLAGSLVVFFSTLAQGSSMPPTDRGLWLVDQNGVGRMAARHGAPAPGTEVGMMFTP